jgi:hypothetical protein
VIPLLTACWPAGQRHYSHSYCYKPAGLRLNFNLLTVECMLIHKFIHKYPQPPAVPLMDVLWCPAEDVKYPTERDHSRKWKILVQEDITIKKIMGIELKFGVEVLFCVVLVSLMHKFQQMKLIIQNESVLETTNDIVISKQSNLNNDIVIKVGDVLCYLTCKYLNYWK